MGRVHGESIIFDGTLSRDNQQSGILKMKNCLTFAFVIVAFISCTQVYGEGKWREKYLLVEIVDPVTSRPDWKATWKPTWKPAQKPTWKPPVNNYGNQRGYEPREPTWKKPTWKPHPLDVTPIPPMEEYPTFKPTWKPKKKPNWKPNPYEVNKPIRGGYGPILPTWKPKPTWKPTLKPAYKPNYSADVTPIPPMTDPAKRPEYKPSPYNPYAKVEKGEGYRWLPNAYGGVDLPALNVAPPPPPPGFGGRAGPGFGAPPTEYGGYPDPEYGGY